MDFLGSLLFKVQTVALAKNKNGHKFKLKHIKSSINWAFIKALEWYPHTYTRMHTHTAFGQIMNVYSQMESSTRTNMDFPLCFPLNGHL